MIIPLLVILSQERFCVVRNNVCDVKTAGASGNTTRRGLTVNKFEAEEG